MIVNVLSFHANLGRRAKQYLKQWTRPVSATLVTTIIPDPTRVSGSACQLDFLGPIPSHQVKSSLQRCWVVFILVLAEYSHPLRSSRM